MPLNLNNVSITIPSDVVTQLKQVFLPTDDERVKFAEATDPKAIAKELIDTHGDALVNGIVDQHGSKIAKGVAEQIKIDAFVQQLDVDTIAQSYNDQFGDDLAGAIADRFDRDDIAHAIGEHIDMSSIAEEISVSDVAREIDLGDLAREIDTELISQRVAGRIDVSDIAECFSNREIADEFYAGDIAENIDVADVASHIEISDEIVAKEFVKFLTTNPDGMRHFMDAFCRAYISMTTTANA